MTRPPHVSPWSLRRYVPAIARGGEAGAGRRRLWSALGVLLLLAAATPSVWSYLVAYPPEIWQVDLEVYRAGSKALLEGFPLYEVRTPSPQFLPFTYPPFAALAGLPLAVMSLRAAGWVWMALQLALLWFIVGRAFGPLLARFGARAGVVHGLIAGVCVWFLPVQDTLRYGQVNAIIVALCLADATRRESSRLPRGSLVGLAVAVKLTPGIFWGYWAVRRRWRLLVASVGAFVAVTVGSAVVSPRTSWDFWADALLDSDRLGPNDGTANQSLRGILLRLGPDGTAGSLVWLVLAGAAACAGLWLAHRAEQAGDQVAVVAVLGLTAVLVSPVSWIHHAYWGVLAVGVLVGDGRRPARLVAAGVATALLLMRLPWWGGAWADRGSVPRPLALAVQNSYAPLALLAFAAIAVLVLPRRSRLPVGAGDVEDADDQRVGVAP